MKIQLKTESTSKSARSKMLKTVMPLLSGENGQDLASAIDSKDADKVKVVMQRITTELENKFRKTSS